jgi:alkylhydroperoxidase/carboxymuconolactone decarboxylase family protein YurZ
MNLYSENRRLILIMENGKPMKGIGKQEIYEHFEDTLEISMPEFWMKLGEHAPWVLEGYYKMREPVFRDIQEGGALPKKFKELLVVGMDILMNNPWGAKVHTRAAIRSGATMEELTEVIVLMIMGGGMLPFRKVGYEVYLAAEEALKEMEEEKRQ